MIDFYAFNTPNARKISIMLEEVGLPYTVHRVDITNGDQFKPEFLAINPNNKIPAIVDAEGPDGRSITVFESGAILIYLAEKTGSSLLPKDLRRRTEVIQWLMFQMAGLGPMLGQAHHFRRYAPEQVPYAIKRYTDEAQRLWGVLDKRLAEHEFLAEDFSVADIATYPWLTRHEYQGISLEAFPNVRRYMEAVAARPAVERGMNVALG